jgi:hypothetical protein
MRAGLTAHEFERLRNGNHVIHAWGDRKCFDFMASSATADGRNDGALGAASDVRLEPSLADALDNVFDLFFGSAVGHIHNHGDDLSCGGKKQKPRLLSRLGAESFELFLNFFCYAPILHLRRGWKPIAAKQAKGVKSCHRSHEPGVYGVLYELLSLYKYFRIPNRLWRGTQGTGNTGKCIIGISPNQPHSPDHQYENDGEHHCVFGDILPLLVRA